MWDALPEDWRPDKSGVFVDRVRLLPAAMDAIGPQYDRSAMVQLLLLRPDAIGGAHFAETVWSLVNAGIPVFLGVCGPPGHQNALVFLNDAAQAPVMQRDRNGVMAVIRDALATALAHKCQPLPRE